MNLMYKKESKNREKYIWLRDNLSNTKRCKHRQRDTEEEDIHQQTYIKKNGIIGGVVTR